MTEKYLPVNQKKEDRIIRAPRDRAHPYMQLYRKIPQDRRMTFEERAILIFILSMPDYWEISPRSLNETEGVGINKLKRIFTKYQSLGYVSINKIRNERGLFTHTEYLFYEEPIEMSSQDPQHGIRAVDEKYGIQRTESIARIPCGGQGGNSEGHTLYNNKIHINNINTPPNPQRGEPAKAGGVEEDKSSSSVKELAKEVVELLVKHNPMYKPVNPAILTKELGLLMADDRVTPEIVRNVIEWALNHHIWHAVLYKKRNVAAYLREKFGQLYASMTAPKPVVQKERRFAPSSNDAKALAIMEEMSRTAL